MAQTASTTSGFSSQYQKYFSKQFIQYAVQATVLDQFAQKAPLPQNAGVKSIRFFRCGAPSVSGLGTIGTGLTEGTAVSTYRTLAQTVVDIALVQYGQVVQLSDVLTMTDFFNSVAQATKINGEDSALHADTVIRNALIAATSPTERYGGTFTSFANLLTASTTNGAITATNILDASTNLKIERAPMIDGAYVGIIPPQVSRDVMATSTWVNAATYSNVAALYKGEIGKLYGIRFVEATNPWVEDETKGTYSTTDTIGTAGLIYSTIITGAQAYGAPELTGNSPMSPRVIIVDTADKADPLNQTVNVGFKTFYAADALNVKYYVILRTKSTYA